MNGRFTVWKEILSMHSECEKIQNEIVKMRRDLHQIPELLFELPKTCAYVMGKLDEFGIKYDYNSEISCIIGYINKGKGHAIALRSDMDALSVTEATGVEYASKHEGRMHACGHDAHMAMLLGAAKILSEHRDELACEVRLIFQPYEEGTRGAYKVVEMGAVDGVEAIFGTHIGTLMGTDIPSGKMTILPGPTMAVSDRFKIVVKGVACHGSTPERGIDPVVASAHIILGLQEIVSREFSAIDRAVISVCTVNGGNQPNAVPDKVELAGTTRSYETEIRDKIERRINEVSAGIAAAYRCTTEFSITKGAPPVVNDHETTAYAVKCAKEVLGDENVITDARPTMVGEDFSVYQQYVPGTFMHLSSSNPEKGTDCEHHSPTFNIDEDVLWKGSAVFVKLAENWGR